MIKTEEELVVTSVVYMLVLSIEKEPYLKSDRKKVVRSLQKQIAIYRNSIPQDKYLELVHLAPELLNMIKDSLSLRNVKQETLLITSPAHIFTIIRNRHPSYYHAMGVDEKALSKLEAGYKDVGLLFPTLMLVNRLFEHLPKLLATDTINTIDRLTSEL